MFDPTDNLPDPERWQRGRKGRILRTAITAIFARWEMIQFAKYVIHENLNSSDDIDTIVDRWIQEHN